MRVYGYWHNRAVDGKAHCNHYAHGPDGPLWVDLMSAMSSILGSDDAGIDLATDLMAAIQPYIEREEVDAARLRSLAAIFDSHLNRDKTFTGSEVASMLRDGKG